MIQNCKKLLQLQTIAATVDVKINQFENSFKTSKNYRKKMFKICSGIEDISLVKRIVDKNETNASLNPKGVHLKSQKSRKSRIKYTKLYELTEIPDRSNIHTYYKPTSSNVHKMLVSPQENFVDKPSFVKCYTISSNEIAEKSSVEPITPVLASKSKLFI